MAAQCIGSSGQGASAKHCVHITMKESALRALNTLCVDGRLRSFAARQLKCVYRCFADPVSFLLQNWGRILERFTETLTYGELLKHEFYPIPRNYGYIRNVLYYIDTL